jgi:hypothetical protein
MDFVTILGRFLNNGVSKRYSEYTVEELQALTIWERVKLNDWRLEMITLGFTLGYILLFVLGDRYNKSLITGFLSGVSDVFNKNFFQFGVNAKDLYIKDSAENYSSYATGRVNIAKVNINFTLQPRQNVFVWFFEYVLSFFFAVAESPEDRVDIVITPSAEYDNFILGFVSKLGMNESRNLNYYLSLTKTTDSPSLPQSFVYMSEANEFQEKLTTQEIKAVLNNSVTTSFLKYLAFTDQPAVKPDSIKECYPNRRIVISANLTTKKEQLKQLSNLLEAVFIIIDKLASKDISFRPEALKKIVKTREGEIAKIQKMIDLKKQEDAEYEKAQVKKQERDQYRKLSKEEQIKFEKKKLEKEKKKMQKKQKVRM